MAAVDVGVTEDDDPSVTRVRHIEVFAGTGANCGDEGLGFGVFDDLLQAGLTRVHDLASKWQHCHGLGVSTLLGRTGCRVALHDEELGVHAMNAAICQLVRHSGRGERGRFASKVKLLFRRDTVDDRLRHLLSQRVDLRFLAAAGHPVGEA